MRWAIATRCELKILGRVINGNFAQVFFLKNGPNPASFWFIFRSFSQHKDKYSTNFTINAKSIDGVLGSRTQGGRMEGADGSTELSPKFSQTEVQLAVLDGQ